MPTIVSIMTIIVIVNANSSRVSLCLWTHGIFSLCTSASVVFLRASSCPLCAFLVCVLLLDFAVAAKRLGVQPVQPPEVPEYSAGSGTGPGPVRTPSKYSGCSGCSGCSAGCSSCSACSGCSGCSGCSEVFRWLRCSASLGKRLRVFRSGSEGVQESGSGGVDCSGGCSGVSRAGSAVPLLLLLYPLLLLLLLLVLLYLNVSSTFVHVIVINVVVFDCIVSFTSVATSSSVDPKVPRATRRQDQNS